MSAPTPRHRTRRWPVIAAALLVLILVAACSGEDSDSAMDTDDAGTDQADTVEAGAAATPQAADGEVALSGEATERDAAGDAEAPADDSDASAAPIPDPAQDTAATGERIIKEGTITVEVEPGDFDAAFGQVVSRAQALGGHVSGTSSSTEPGPDDEVLTSGQVTIRIPVRNFEDLLTSIGDAGEVVDRNITSEDVTAEFTDLESRRRNLQAQERFYLGLLEEAAGVQDAIAVQQQLDDIQRQIEQITGRLNLLADRSAFSTLTVRIHERGTAAVETEPGTEPGGLTPYIEDAVDTFVMTVGALIIFATFIAPFLVLALIGYGIWRSVRRRRAADQATAGPATQPAGPPPVEPTHREPAGVGAAPSESDG